MIFKCCESEMYLIVLLPNYKRIYDLINLIKKWIRALYREFVLFLRSKKVFATYQIMRANRTFWVWTRHKSGETTPNISKIYNISLPKRLIRVINQRVYGTHIYPSQHVLPSSISCTVYTTYVNIYLRRVHYSFKNHIWYHAMSMFI